MFVLPARTPRKRAPSSKPRGHPEQSLQQAVAAYLWTVLEPPTFFTSIGHGGFPLGGTREEARIKGARLKKSGLKPGVPDVLIVHNGRALFLELKTSKGVVSENQKTAHKWIVASGGLVAVCRSVDDVKGILDVWGVPTRESGGLRQRLVY